MEGVNAGCGNDSRVCWWSRQVGENFGDGWVGPGVWNRWVGGETLVIIGENGF